ncbi:hypothetical protein J4H92_01400 [Leucobacter weissii]|uniref:Uncharacterized protein n=1 Tax=Leucobacter weissii TaxID=1983706 RepID=A0A939MKP6_9MICO|nr:hypothetical protein [Leucobacter weissii]MBO1900602.1 hypothetical protein [Leucobacter weissii]
MQQQRLRRRLTGVFMAVAMFAGGLVSAAGPAASAAEPDWGGAPSPPAAATTWPGGSAVTTALSGTGEDTSGLAYEPATADAPAKLWVVNNRSYLYRYDREGGAWVRKELRLIGGTPAFSLGPDSEGVTLTGGGSAAGVYVASERGNGTQNGVSRVSILRYDVTGPPPTSGLRQNATHEWNLTPDFPGLEANSGFESVEWVPDADLVTAGFVDQNTGAVYDPSRYGDHAEGLFFVGVEQGGGIHAYALNHTTGAYTRIATIAATADAARLGAGTVMGLHWDVDRRQLWALCDNHCSGRVAVYQLVAGGEKRGTLQLTRVLNRPSGLPNSNWEGLAFAPEAECVSGVRPVWWADDNGAGGVLIRQGTLNCPGVPTTPPEAVLGEFTGEAVLPETAVIGEAVTVDVSGITPTPDRVSIQWQDADGADLAGETAAGHTPGYERAPDGTIIVPDARRAVVTVSKAGYWDTTTTTGYVEPEPPTFLATPAPALSWADADGHTDTGGEPPRIGDTITATHAEWTSPVEAAHRFYRPGYAYEWLRDGQPIPGARTEIVETRTDWQTDGTTPVSYTVKAADLGRTLSLRASYLPWPDHPPLLQPAEAVSEATAPVEAAKPVTVPPAKPRVTSTASANYRVAVKALTGKKLRITVTANRGYAKSRLPGRATLRVAGVKGSYPVKLRNGTATLRLGGKAKRLKKGKRVRVTATVPRASYRTTKATSTQIVTTTHRAAKTVKKLRVRLR